MHLVDIYKEDAITWENICDGHPHMLPTYERKTTQNGKDLFCWVVKISFFLLFSIV